MSKIEKLNSNINLKSSHFVGAGWIIISQCKMQTT